MLTSNQNNPNLSSKDELMLKVNQRQAKNHALALQLIQDIQDVISTFREKSTKKDPANSIIRSLAATTALNADFMQQLSEGRYSLDKAVENIAGIEESIKEATGENGQEYMDSINEALGTQTPSTHFEASMYFKGNNFAEEYDKARGAINIAIEKIQNLLTKEIGKINANKKTSEKYASIQDKLPALRDRVKQFQDSHSGIRDDFTALNKATRESQARIDHTIAENATSEALETIKQVALQIREVKGETKKASENLNPRAKEGWKGMQHYCDGIAETLGAGIAKKKASLTQSKAQQPAASFVNPTSGLKNPSSVASTVFVSESDTPNGPSSTNNDPSSVMDSASVVSVMPKDIEPETQQYYGDIEPETQQDYGDIEPETQQYYGDIEPETQQDYEEILRNLPSAESTDRNPTSSSSAVGMRDFDKPIVTEAELTHENIKKLTLDELKSLRANALKELARQQDIWQERIEDVILKGEKLWNNMPQDSRIGRQNKKNFAARLSKLKEARNKINKRRQEMKAALEKADDKTLITDLNNAGVPVTSDDLKVALFFHIQDGKVYSKLTSKYLSSLQKVSESELGFNINPSHLSPAQVQQIGDQASDMFTLSKGVWYNLLASRISPLLTPISFIDNLIRERDQNSYEKETLLDLQQRKEKLTDIKNNFKKHISKDNSAEEQVQHFIEAQIHIVEEAAQNLTARQNGKSIKSKTQIPSSEAVSHSVFFIAPSHSPDNPVELNLSEMTEDQIKGEISQLQESIFNKQHSYISPLGKRLTLFKDTISDIKHSFTTLNANQFYLLKFLNLFTDSYLPLIEKYIKIMEQFEYEVDKIEQLLRENGINESREVIRSRLLNAVHQDEIILGMEYCTDRMLAVLPYIVNNINFNQQKIDEKSVQTLQKMADYIKIFKGSIHDPQTNRDIIVNPNYAISSDMTKSNRMARELENRHYRKFSKEELLEEKKQLVQLLPKLKTSLMDRSTTNNVYNVSATLFVERRVKLVDAALAKIDQQEIEAAEKRKADLIKQNEAKQVQPLTTALNTTTVEENDPNDSIEPADPMEKSQHLEGNTIFSRNKNLGNPGEAPQFNAGQRDFDQLALEFIKITNDDINKLDLDGLKELRKKTLQELARQRSIWKERVEEIIRKGEEFLEIAPDDSTLSLNKPIKGFREKLQNLKNAVAKIEERYSKMADAIYNDKGLIDELKNLDPSITSDDLEAALFFRTKDGKVYSDLSPKYLDALLELLHAEMNFTIGELKEHQKVNSEVTQEHADIFNLSSSLELSCFLNRSYPLMAFVQNIDTAIRQKKQEGYEKQDVNQLNARKTSFENIRKNFKVTATRTSSTDEQVKEFISTQIRIIEKAAENVKLRKSGKDVRPKTTTPSLDAVAWGVFYSPVELVSSSSETDFSNMTDQGIIARLQELNNDIFQKRGTETIGDQKNLIELMGRLESTTRKLLSLANQRNDKSSSWWLDLLRNSYEPLYGRYKKVMDRLDANVEQTLTLLREEGIYETREALMNELRQAVEKNAVFDGIIADIQVWERFTVSVFSSMINEIGARQEGTYKNSLQDLKILFTLIKKLAISVTDNQTNTHIQLDTTLATFGKRQEANKLGYELQRRHYDKLTRAELNAESKKLRAVLDNFTPAKGGTTTGIYNDSIKSLLNVRLELVEGYLAELNQLDQEKAQAEEFQEKLFDEVQPEKHSSDEDKNKKSTGQPPFVRPSLGEVPVSTDVLHMPEESPTSQNLNIEQQADIYEQRIMRFLEQYDQNSSSGLDERNLNALQKELDDYQVDQGNSRKKIIEQLGIFVGSDEEQATAYDIPEKYLQFEPTLAESLRIFQELDSNIELTWNNARATHQKYLSALKVTEISEPVLHASLDQQINSDPQYKELVRVLNENQYKLSQNLRQLSDVIQSSGEDLEDSNDILRAIQNMDNLLQEQIRHSNSHPNLTALQNLRDNLLLQIGVARQTSVGNQLSKLPVVPELNPLTNTAENLSNIFQNIEQEKAARLRTSNNEAGPHTNSPNTIDLNAIGRLAQKELDMVKSLYNKNFPAQKFGEIPTPFLSQTLSKPRSENEYNTESREQDSDNLFETDDEQEEDIWDFNKKSNANKTDNTKQIREEGEKDKGKPQTGMFSKVRKLGTKLAHRQSKRSNIGNLQNQIAYHKKEADTAFKKVDKLLKYYNGYSSGNETLDNQNVDLITALNNLCTKIGTQIKKMNEPVNLENKTKQESIDILTVKLESCVKASEKIKQAIEEAVIVTDPIMLNLSNKYNVKKANKNSLAAIFKVSSNRLVPANQPTRVQSSNPLNSSGGSQFSGSSSSKSNDPLYNESPASYPTAESLTQYYNTTTNPLPHGSIGGNLSVENLSDLNIEDLTMNSEDNEFTHKNSHLVGIRNPFRSSDSEHFGNETSENHDYDESQQDKLKEDLERTRAKLESKENTIESLKRTRKGKLDECLSAIEAHDLIRRNIRDLPSDSSQETRTNLQESLDAQAVLISDLQDETQEMHDLIRTEEKEKEELEQLILSLEDQIYAYMEQNIQGLRSFADSTSLYMSSMQSEYVTANSSLNNLEDLEEVGTNTTLSSSEESLAIENAVSKQYIDQITDLSNQITELKRNQEESTDQLREYTEQRRLDFQQINQYKNQLAQKVLENQTKQDQISKLESQDLKNATTAGELQKLGGERDRLVSEQRQLEQQIDTLNEKNQVLLGMSETLNSKKVADQNSLQALQEELNSVQAQEQDLKRDLEAAKNDLREARKEVSTNKQKIADMNAEYRQLEGKRTQEETDSNSKIQELTESTLILERQIQDYKDIIDGNLSATATKEYEVISEQEMINMKEQMEKLIIELEQSQTELAAAKEQREQTNDQALNETRELRNQVLGTNLELHYAKQEVKSLKAQKQNILSSHTNAINDREVMYQNQLQEATIKNDTLESTLLARQTQLNELNNRLAKYEAHQVEQETQTAQQNQALKLERDGLLQQNQDLRQYNIALQEANQDLTERESSTWSANVGLIARLDEAKVSIKQLTELVQNPLPSLNQNASYSGSRSTTQPEQVRENLNTRFRGLSEGIYYESINKSQNPFHIPESQVFQINTKYVEEARYYFEFGPQPATIKTRESTVIISAPNPEQKNIKIDISAANNKSFTMIKHPTQDVSLCFKLTNNLPTTTIIAGSIEITLNRDTIKNFQTILKQYFPQYTVPIVLDGVQGSISSTKLLDSFGKPLRTKSAQLLIGSIGNSEHPPRIALPVFHTVSSPLVASPVSTPVSISPGSSRPGKGHTTGGIG